MEQIKLTPREQERCDIIRSCIDGDMTNKEASARLGLKTRQVQRLKRKVEKDEKQGILHGLRGRLSNNSTGTTVKDAVIAFFTQKKHRDFGPTFAREKLAGLGIIMSTEAVRLLMVKHGLWKPKPRRGPTIVREWRERKEHFGELVQFDGSYT